jgi:uncharacterized protein
VVSERGDVVRRLFAAVEAQDLDAVLGCYSDEVEIRESPSLPYGGVYRGLRGARDHAVSFMQVWGPYQVGREPLRASVGETDDDRVVVVFRHHAVDEVRGVRLDEDEVAICEVRDGVIVRSTMLHADPEGLARFLAAGSVR